MNTLLIGYGFMGRIHARVLSKLQYLAGVVDVSDELLQKAKQDHDVIVAKSIEDIKDQISIDSVIIAVPTQYHNDVMKQVDKHFPDIKSVLIEKPFVDSIDTYQKNKDLWDKYLEKCIVGHIEIYNPVISHFFKIINDGAYGQLRTITINRKGAVPITRLESLAGVVEDVGVHDLDILTRLMKGKLTIYATGLELNSRMNSVLINIRNDETQAIIHLSREFAGRERKITIEMEKATIIVDLIAQTIELRELGEVIGENNSVKVPHGPGSSIKVYGEPLQEEILNLKNVGLGIEKPVVTINNGISTLKIVEAVKKSIQENVIVTYDA